MKKPTITISRDEIQERLDELALIAAAYKSARDAERPTQILRRAFLDAARDALASVPPVGPYRPVVTISGEKATARVVRSG